MELIVGQKYAHAQKPLSFNISHISIQGLIRGIRGINLLVDGPPLEHWVKGTGSKRSQIKRLLFICIIY